MGERKAGKTTEEEKLRCLSSLAMTSNLTKKFPLTKEDCSVLLGAQSEKVSELHEVQNGSETHSRAPEPLAHDDRRVNGGRYPLTKEDTMSCLPAESSTLSSDHRKGNKPQANKPLCSELCDECDDTFFQETEGFLPYTSKMPLKACAWNQQHICEAKAPFSSRINNEGYQYIFQLPKTDSKRDITVETSKDGWLFIASNTNPSSIAVDHIQKQEETKDITACDEILNVKTCTFTECVLQEAAASRKQSQQSAPQVQQKQQKRQKSCTQSTGASDAPAFTTTLALPAEADLAAVRCKYDAVECVLEVFFPKTTPKYLNLCCS